MAMDGSKIQDGQSSEACTRGASESGFSPVGTAGTSSPTVDGKVAGGKKRKRVHYTGRAKGADETRRLDEARTKLGAVRGRIQEFAQGLVHEVYGEHGPEWGTRFRDIEILGDVIGAEVATRFTEGSVGEQAEVLPEEAHDCPCCGGTGERQEDDEPRSVQTLTGVVDWNESEFYCEACRRSFFPSEPCFGD